MISLILLLGTPIRSPSLPRDGGPRGDADSPASTGKQPQAFPRSEGPWLLAKPSEAS